MPLVLASASPRRRLLLQTAGIPVAAVLPADLDESLLPGESAREHALRLAEEKALAVSRRHGGEDWVLAADTVVHTRALTLGKPADDAEATEMLEALAGRWHTVSTAWALAWAGEAPRPGSSGIVSTDVRIRDLSEAELAAYVATGEPLDKAGAYGIQGRGAAIVAEVRGDYSAVVGLPMEAVLGALDARGIRSVGPLPEGAP